MAVGSQDQLRSFTGRSEQSGVDHGAREEKFKGALGGDERSSVVKDQGGFEGKSRGYSDRGEAALVNNQAGLQAQVGNIAGSVGEVEPGHRVDDVKPKNQPPSQPRFRGSQIYTRSLSGQFEGGFSLRFKEAPSDETEADQSASQLQWVEDPEVPRIKVQKPPSAAPEQIMKLQGRRDESGSAYGSNKLVFPSKKVSENQESLGYVSAASVEQVQRARQSKGNQELNDELKMKANELEKLFAEHKQSGSTRRSKPTDLQVEQAISSQYRKPAAVEISTTQLLDNKAEFEPIMNASENMKFSTPPMKMVDHQDYSSSLRQNFSELSFSDDSRGKFYERYMQKRDAKLREEWGTKRAEKEAKLKAMQDSLEQSRSEMKAKFSGSADRSSSGARQLAEKLRTYHSRMSIKREQHLIDSLQSEEDEDPSEFMEQKYYRQDRSFSEASLMDGTSRSSQNKKLLLNRNLSSSTPRTTAAPVPRSSAKMSNTSSARRRMQSENPLAQSVPNFSDFRKENTKPSSGVSKTTNRTQVRTYARSKSTAEETPLAKEEKPRRSQSLRKSSAGPAEFKDLSLNSDDVLMPLKFDKEQTEQGLYERFSKNVEPKPFLRKGNGIGPGAGTSIAKVKASVASEPLKNEEEFEESPFEADDSVNGAKEEEEEEVMEEEELETTEVEDYANNGHGKPRLSQESDKMSESENDESLRSHSQIDPSSVPELPTSISSTFHAVGSLQDSPGGSPVSWNSRMHNPFSYPHEISDIDASNQARKDVTKGFKRLLKFGRKSRGAESLVDWISATTSEGDDDTEDGRDPANRSSEDLRKSRMGFSHSHASDDCYNESELFNEQVQSIHSSIPAPPANFKLRDDHMSGSSIKGY
ncbi:conserved hypothetical protein [Ricinus communis]|uniref:Uncharacterized protein n=1 Tax=Ricinus communis TaxID=3988 RepID=B9ST62_RICCO|nr:conserved hypothetical protein [Ricinus communis]